jgi:CubicO group peptidase (beta-lactamase class C family)
MSISARILEDAITIQHRRSPFSGVVSVREQDEVIFNHAFGFANMAEQFPNTPYTRFGMASGAKTFTSVAVCQLVERGLISFNARLKDCLDVPLPHFDPAVTVHHLLSHSSGIPDYFDEAVMDDYEALWRERPMYTLRTPMDFLPLFSGEAMKSKPGARWVYNNAGFVILGLVIEQHSGMAFQDYVGRHIFHPCGMTDSGYFAMDRLPAGTALGYIPVGDDEWRTNIYSIPIVGGPDGGAYTTVPDMGKFWDALMDGRLLNRATITRMLTPYWSTRLEDEDTSYGYGIWIKQEKGEPLAYYMLGEDPGVAFVSGIYPASRIQFSLMGNTVSATWPMLRCITPILKTV